MFSVFLVLTVSVPIYEAHMCGCKNMRSCYLDMLNTLRDKDEEACIENSSIGMNTLTVYLRALAQFCPDLVKVKLKHYTYEGRPLYEVIITEKTPDNDKPTIIIDAGQQSGVDTTLLTLIFMQQLTACSENSDMAVKVKWVIMPATNPDGMEYTRFNHIHWKKNLRPSEDNLTYGVDITRNFSFKWADCYKKVISYFSVRYPGTSAASENETIFIQEVLQKHRNARAYISLRLNGHALLYPYAYSRLELKNAREIKHIANEIALKVNMKAGLIHFFTNESIFDMNGKPRCGSSVDYAYNLGIPYAFEMRTFLGSETKVIALFQDLHKGYKNSLIVAYLIGFRKLFDLIVREKKRKSLF